MIQISLLDPKAPDWNDQIESIRRRLGAPHNPHLLPEHFLKVVLPKIGGSIADVRQQDETAGYGFLFPRAVERGRRIFTLRYHNCPNATQTVDAQQLTAAIEAHVGCDVVFYDPSAPKTYNAGHRLVGDLDFGCPSGEEAEKVRQLQQQVWGNPPDLLYPADIHSVEFRLATTLVARDQGKPVGFLFGFYKFGGSDLPNLWRGRINADLRVESQTMGVLPEQRGRNIGFTFKQLQAETARGEGIDVINWTADPLLFANAALNFSKLRAVAFDFHPALYDLHNDLNRVAASRFSLTWLVSSERVRTAAEENRSRIVDVGTHTEIVQVNWGTAIRTLTADAPLIAVEIPPNWYGMQQIDPVVAQTWRQRTDHLFAAYVGKEPGQYVITAAGVDGDRRFLIGEQVDGGLLTRLVQ